MYAKLGVDSGKKEVREVFDQYVDNDFPEAFVNIVRDPSRPGEVFTQHMDGDGSKFVQRLLIFKETGDANIIRGAVDDAVSMNLGDIAAAGFVNGKIVITDVIDINGFNVPKKEIMEQIGERFREIKELYRSFGFNSFFFLGGETADLPHQVQTIVFNVSVYAEAKESEIIIGNTVPGDKIFGFASDGQAAWENEYNSGIMSNGLTLGRVETMWAGYTSKYPQLIVSGNEYNGSYRVGDKDNRLPMSISDALISPTRQWAILIKLLLEKLESKGIRNMLHGISMNTGGGATKIGHVGRGIYYKKRMPPLSGIFKIIQEQSGEKYRNMYKSFNCGIGIDVVGEDDPKFKTALLEVSEETAIKLFDLGRCHTYYGGGNRIELTTPYGIFNDY